MEQVDWVDELDKAEKEFVLVEAISQYRIRYVVEVPKGNEDWASDVVVMEKAKEFSQYHLGETIVSSRVIDKSEIIPLCHIDNSYTDGWDDEINIRNFVTLQKEYEGDD